MGWSRWRARRALSSNSSKTRLEDWAFIRPLPSPRTSTTTLKYACPALFSSARTLPPRVFKFYFIWTHIGGALACRVRRSKELRRGECLSEDPLVPRLFVDRQHAQHSQHPQGTVNASLPRLVVIPLIPL